MRHEINFQTKNTHSLHLRPAQQSKRCRATGISDAICEADVAEMLGCRAAQEGVEGGGVGAVEAIRLVENVLRFAVNLTANA